MEANDPTTPAQFGDGLLFAKGLAALHILFGIILLFNGLAKLGAWLGRVDRYLEGIITRGTIHEYFGAAQRALERKRIVGRAAPAVAVQ